MTAKTVGVGMLGCGTVGSAVARLIRERGDDIERRAGVRLEVRRVAVRDRARERVPSLDPGLLTTDPAEVVRDPEVEVVCELLGGVEPARSSILEALAAGKPVVTANKELLANHGADLLNAADASGADLAFEGAVGGGIPVIRALKQSLAGERITRVTGIVNGTTNFVLTRMSEEGLSFGDALAEARSHGYAEADPSADVEGHDAAAKCAILASIAFNTRVTAGDVFREGIADVQQEDIANAAVLGYVVKPVAIAELEGEDVAVRVHPAMIPAEHPLASVRDAYNAVFVEGERVGELMLYGPGAGGDATATAVVGDLVAVARNRVFGGRLPGCTCYLDRRLRPMDDMEGAYYLLLDVADRPGVLAGIAGAFGDNGVSIKSVWQEGTGEEAQIVMITHRAREGSLQDTVRALRELPAVAAVRSVLRVEAAE